MHIIMKILLAAYKPLTFDNMLFLFVCLYNFRPDEGAFDLPLFFFRRQRETAARSAAVFFS